MSKAKKIVKTIRIDPDLCNGCRACELICSAFHATPKYSSNDPDRSRIRVVHDPIKDVYLPVYAGEYTASECMGKNKYVIDGKEYSDCDFCRAACPSRTLFHDPDTGLPLRCDMCEDDPPLEEPMCVQWCITDALIYEEKEEDVEQDQEEKEDIEVGLEAMVDTFGLQKVLESLTRVTNKS